MISKTLFTFLGLAAAAQASFLNPFSRGHAVHLGAPMEAPDPSFFHYTGGNGDLPSAPSVHAAHTPFNPYAATGPADITGVEPQAMVRYFSNAPYAHTFSPVSRGGADYGNGLTPYLTWYVPTRKCDGKWYCRAQITVYQEFTGKLVVQMGYSVWHFNSPSATVPGSTLRRIAGTSDSEIIDYIKKLAPKMKETYPKPAVLCPVSFPAAIAAFKKVIGEVVSECSKTANFICEKSSTAATC